MIEKLGGTTSDMYCDPSSDPAAPWFNDQDCYRLRSKMMGGKFNCSAEPIPEEENKQRVCYCHMNTGYHLQFYMNII